MVLSTALAFIAMPSAKAAEGAWAQRVQVVYDARSGTVSRQLLRVWNPVPDLDLEFTWEPEPGSAFRPSADGTVSGRGTLVWRIRGSSAHDRRSVHSTFTGDLADGRPHGSGRLELRSGERFEGNWVAGILDGEGMHLDASGNRYSGTFADSLPHGQGRQAMADGTIYEGGFRNGRRHGAGRLRLPGGTARMTEWQDGIEIGSGGPDRLADALVGGLVRAQAGGGDAGKVDLSIVVDQRMTQQSELQYQHAVLDDRIEIYPLSDDMVSAWIGQATISEWVYGGTFGGIDWEDAPSFLQVEFKTGDGSRVALERLELQVADSQVYRKPFLSVVGHRGCIGYRPAFSFQNNGWGPVRDAAMEVQFYNPDRPESGSRSLTLPVPDFDEGADVDIEPLLRQAGVDVATLAGSRFTCPSEAQLDQCRSDILSSLDLGELTGLFSGYASLEVGLRGRLRYRWQDDYGNVYDADEPLEAMVQLGVIETELMVAEGGDAWGGSPEALRYQVIELPESGQDYSIDLPVRGNRNLAAYVARLKVYAEHTSIHRFRVVASFKDGSTRQTLPVSYFHIRPRDVYYDPAEPAQECFLDPSYTPPR